LIVNPSRQGVKAGHSTPIYPERPVVSPAPPATADPWQDPPRLRTLTGPARCTALATARDRSPGQMLATAAPWTGPGLPPGYEQNFWNAA